MDVPLPVPRPTTRLQPQPQPPSFEKLAKQLDYDVTRLAQVSQYLKTLAQLVESVRAEARDAGKPLQVGARKASPFADPRAGDAIDLLANNTRSIQRNVDDSLADLHRCLTQTAAAMDRLGTSVQDSSQENQRRLRQVLDTAFNPQARTGQSGGMSMPPMRPTPKTGRF